MPPKKPNFAFEKTFDGLVCGLDEVGRAPLAGPVVAACVYIPQSKIHESVWIEVNDSKMVAAKKREILAHEIKLHACWAIAEASHDEVETFNIVQASFLAMRRAYGDMCKNFGVNMDLALIDGHLTPRFPCPTQSIIKGDSKSVSIAAASIIAKTYRDGLMQNLAREYPHYGWETNAGYPTRKHLEGINTHGLSPLHRKSFAPVRNFLTNGCVYKAA
ncbi:MAG: ribonuclease HII [Alphaproteobacteria bacterium]